MPQVLANVVQLSRIVTSLNETIHLRVDSVRAGSVYPALRHNRCQEVLNGDARLQDGLTTRIRSCVPETCYQRSDDLIVVDLSGRRMTQSSSFLPHSLVVASASERAHSARLRAEPRLEVYLARASRVGGMSERTCMPQWSPARVTIHSAGTVM